MDRVRWVQSLRIGLAVPWKAAETWDFCLGWTSVGGSRVLHRKCLGGYCCCWYSSYCYCSSSERDGSYCWWVLQTHLRYDSNWWLRYWHCWRYSWVLGGISMPFHEAFTQMLLGARVRWLRDPQYLRLPAWALAFQFTTALRCVSRGDSLRISASRRTPCGCRLRNLRHSVGRVSKYAQEPLRSSILSAQACGISRSKADLWRSCQSIKIIRFQEKTEKKWETTNESVCLGFY